VALARAAGCQGLVGGQADDIAGQAAGLAAIEAMHRRKTGALVEVALRLGGLVAGAGVQQLQALEEYGRCLGLAFQITDDLLDVRGDEAALGKRVGKDFDHGKLTFPAMLGVEASAERAESLVAGACRAIAPVCGAGSHLESLARWVLERNR
jgi:geranylgeranyl diphosphate synthase, type II